MKWADNDYILALFVTIATILSLASACVMFILAPFLTAFVLLFAFVYAIILAVVKIK